MSEDNQEPEEENTNDLSWVEFSEENSPETKCEITTCTSVSTHKTRMTFNCGHFPNEQIVCLRHKDLIEDMFSDSPKYQKNPTACTKCSQIVEFLGTTAYREGEDDE